MCYINCFTFLDIIRSINICLLIFFQGGEVVSLKWKRIEGFMSVKGSIVTKALPHELKVKPQGTSLLRMVPLNVGTMIPF